MKFFLFGLLSIFTASFPMTPWKQASLYDDCEHGICCPIGPEGSEAYIYPVISDLGVWPMLSSLKTTR